MYYWQAEEGATPVRFRSRSIENERSYDSVKESVDRERKFSPEKTARPQESWEAVAGGIILIAMGILSMMDAFVNFHQNVSDSWMVPLELSFPEYRLLSLVSVAGSIVAVVGGEMAILRMSYRIAVAGSIVCAVVSWLWYNWFGLAVGLVGTILISVSSEQFERSKNDRLVENLILGTEKSE